MRNPLSLRKLTGEPGNAFSAFFLYATEQPVKTIRDFARRHGFNRTSVDRWRERYQWDERIQAFYDLRCRHKFGPLDAPPASQPVAVPTAENRSSIDFRAETVALARRAIDNWFSESDHPVTLQGLTRILELACKLNPPPPVASSQSASGDQSFADFMASLERIYGDKAREIRRQRAAAAMPNEETSKK